MRSEDQYERYVCIMCYEIPLRGMDIEYQMRKPISLPESDPVSAMSLCALKALYLSPSVSITCTSKGAPVNLVRLLMEWLRIVNAWHDNPFHGPFTRFRPFRQISPFPHLPFRCTDHISPYAIAYTPGLDHRRR